MLDHERLGRLATDQQTLALLAKRKIDQRLYLNNNLELLPGWREDLGVGRAMLFVGLVCVGLVYGS